MFSSLKRKCVIMLVFSYYHIINIFGRVVENLIHLYF